MIRALSILSGVLLCMALLAGAYGRQQAKKAQGLQILLTQTQDRSATLELELKSRERVLERIQHAAALQSERLQAGEKAAQGERRKGEMQAYRLLTASVPDANQPTALIRWAAQEAQGLTSRLEATP